MEGAMKVQEVMLRAMAKKITWFQAAEIIGISDRHMRRWRERYEESGFCGLLDRRRGKAWPKRVPMAVLERVFCALYSDRGSHFWLTPKVGGKVDPHRLTQVGRALREVGIRMIPAYSPQARER
jgi:transposase